MNKRRRFGYIVEKCDTQTRLCDVEIIASGRIKQLCRNVGRVYYRIEIPDDLGLEWVAKKKCYLTKDERAIADLEWAHILTMWDGRRKVLKNGVNAESWSRMQKHIWQEMRKEPEPVDHNVGAWFVKNGW